VLATRESRCFAGITAQLWASRIAMEEEGRDINLAEEFTEDKEWLAMHNGVLPNRFPASLTIVMP
jgi:hypothetical protein